MAAKMLMENTVMSEQDFYSRQAILKEIGREGQAKLSATKILIVGAGGLGHPVATYLASAGIGQITIIDFDRVEESNLNRQVCFTPSQCGEFKAISLKEKIQLQNPYIKVTALTDRLTANNALDLILSFNLIFDCCDNLATKFLIHDAAWILQKDLVQASIFQYEGQLQVFNFSKKRELGCMRCLWPELPTEGASRNCQEAGLIGAVAGTLGTMQAMEGLKLILNLEESTINTTITVDLLKINISKLKWKKKSSCSLCSDDPLIKKICEANYSSRSFYEIETPQEGEMIFIDIRESEELKGISSKFEHRALSELGLWKAELQKDTKYLFICSKGIRSKKLAQELREQLGLNCFSLHGGARGQY